MVSVKHIATLVAAILVIQMSSPVQGQVYSGGVGDGFAAGSFAEPDNILFNIYQGGNADGHATSGFSQPDNPLHEIYGGSVNDGFSFATFSMADNPLVNIYNGGNNDGFAFLTFAQADNPFDNIYSGGSKDGFAFMAFAQADNILYGIYGGGFGDGFAFLNLGSEVPLPVELVRFTGRYESGSVQLSWQTASELNNDYFDVEKSVYGAAFEPINKVNGGGTTSVPRYYSYKDTHPFAGVNYYRLKQVDLNGDFKYSDVIAVYAPIEASRSGVVIFPNPSHHFQNISIEINDVPEGADTEITFVNSKGLKVLFLTSQTNSEGIVEIQSPLFENLASGMYLLVVKSGVNTFRLKWFLQ